MRKIKMLVIGMIAALAIGGCGSASTESDTVDTVDSSADETTTLAEDITDNDTSETATDVENSDSTVTSETATDSEVVYLESDPLPEIWYGKWICVYSEANYFAEDETIYVKDYDNAFLYTELFSDGTPHECNRWFCYDEDEQVIHIFNEKPFEEGYERDTFEIKKVSESEIVLARSRTGQEVRFEKMDEEATE